MGLFDVVDFVVFCFWVLFMGIMLESVFDWFFEKGEVYYGCLDKEFVVWFEIFCFVGEV